MIGLYFFENDDSTTVTVNSEPIFLPAIEEYDLENMWFQQDGATCHTTRMNLVLLQETFPGRIIFRRVDVNWPPKSCDLTTLDLFVGLRVHADKFSTLEH